jgi:hypothetical protein
MSGAGSPRRSWQPCAHSAEILAHARTLRPSSPSHVRGRLPLARPPPRFPSTTPAPLWGPPETCRDRCGGHAEPWPPPRPRGCGRAILRTGQPTAAVRRFLRAPLSLAVPGSPHCVRSGSGAWRCAGGQGRCGCIALQGDGERRRRRCASAVHRLVRRPFRSMSPSRPLSRPASRPAPRDATVAFGCRSTSRGLVAGVENPRSQARAAASRAAAVQIRRGLAGPRRPSPPAPPRRRGGAAAPPQAPHPCSL